MLLEFSLGKLACEVDQWNCRPQSWGRGISLSLDLTQLTRVHRGNLIRQGYRPIYVEQYIGAVITLDSMLRDRECY